MYPRENHMGCMIFMVCGVVILLVAVGFVTGAKADDYQWLNGDIAASIAGRNDAETDAYRQYTELDVQMKRMEVEKQQLDMQRLRDQYNWEQAERERLHQEQLAQAEYNRQRQAVIIGEINSLGDAAEDAIREWGGSLLVALVGVILFLVTAATTVTLLPRIMELLARRADVATLPVPAMDAPVRTSVRRSVLQSSSNLPATPPLDTDRITRTSKRNGKARIQKGVAITHGRTNGNGTKQEEKAGRTK